MCDYITEAERPVYLCSYASGCVFVGNIIVLYISFKVNLCVFWPPAKGFPNLSSGHGCLVFPLQPDSLPGGDGAAG